MFRFGFSLVSVVIVLLCASCMSTTPPQSANPDALHLAAKFGDYTTIEAALRSGGDINQIDGHGKTPLMYAAADSNVSVVEYLLNKGANPNRIADDGDTPFLVAARKGNSAVVELLIRRGARINEFGEDGLTALAIATAREDKQLFDLLLRLGADPNVSRANYDTALINSIKCRDTYFCNRLIEAGAKSNLKGRGGNTPLIFAVFHNRYELVDRLLSAGARATEVNDSGYNALLFASAVEGIDPAIAKLLIEIGADVNHVSPDGLSPLKVACQAGNADVVLYLYEKGAKPNFDDSSDEGVELNGKMHHILGDYFLAQDDLDRASNSYGKALDYYRKTSDKYNGDVTKLVWTQVGVFVLQALVASAQSYALSYQANIQSRQMGQMAGLRYANKTHTGIQGYYSYMSKYKQTYVPTYNGVNMGTLRPPSGDAPLDVQKAYAKMKAKQFEDRSTLINKVLECFDKNPSGGIALHTCVNSVSMTNSAAVQK
jgi:ankyrin repeat protein